MSGDGDLCNPPTTQPDWFQKEFPEGSRPLAEHSSKDYRDENFKRPHCVEQAFENPDVELELSGEWESESSRDDSKCASDRTYLTPEKTDVADGMESEGWLSDVDTIEQERNAPSNSQLSVDRLDTPEMADVSSGRSPRPSDKLQTDSQKAQDVTVSKDVDTFSCYYHKVMEPAVDILASRNAKVENFEPFMKSDTPDDPDGVTQRKDDRRSLTPNMLSASDRSVSLDADYYDSDTPNTSNIITNEESEVSERRKTRVEDKTEDGEMFQSGSTILEPINEEFIDGDTSTLADSDAEEKENEPLDLFLPSSPVAKEIDPTLSAKINRLESILIGQAEEQSATSDVEDLCSEPGSPVFKTNPAQYINIEVLQSKVNSENTQETARCDNESITESDDGEDHSDTEYSLSDEEESESRTSGVYQIRTSDSEIPELPEEEIEEDFSVSGRCEQIDTGQFGEQGDVDKVDQHLYVDPQQTAKRKLSEESMPLGTCHSERSDPVTKKLRMEEKTVQDMGTLATIHEDNEEEWLSDGNDQITYQIEKPNSGPCQRNPDDVSECTETIDRNDELSTKLEVTDDVARLSDIFSEQGEILDQNLRDGDVREIPNVDESAGIMEDTEQSERLVDKRDITEDAILSMSSEEIIAPDATCCLPVSAASQVIHDGERASFGESAGISRSSTMVGENINTEDTSEVTEHLDYLQEKERNTDTSCETEELHRGTLYDKETERASVCILEHVTDTVESLEDLAKRIVQAHMKNDDWLARVNAPKKQETFATIIHQSGQGEERVVRNIMSMQDDESSESTIPHDASESHLKVEEQVFASETVALSCLEDSKEEQDYTDESAYSRKERHTAVEIHDEASRVAEMSGEIVQKLDEETVNDVECLPDGEEAKKTENISDEVSSVVSKAKNSNFSPEVVVDEQFTEKTSVITHQVSECEAQDIVENEQENREKFEYNDRLPTLSPANVTDTPAVENTDTMSDEPTQQVNSFVESGAQFDDKRTTDCTVVTTIVTESLKSEASYAEEFDSTYPSSPAVSEERSNVISSYKGIREQYRAPEIISAVTRNEVPKKIAERDRNGASVSTVVASPYLQTNLLQKNELQFNASLEVDSSNRQKTTSFEACCTEKRATLKKEITPVEVVCEELKVEETLVPETIIQRESNPKISAVESLETEKVDNVTDVAESKTMNLLTETDSRRPISRTVDQGFTMETVCPIKITKAAASSKKACGSELPKLDGSSKSMICATNVSELVERNSPQKTSPIKDNDLKSVTTEEHEQFSDALTSVDIVISEVQNVATEAKQRVASEVPADGMKDITQQNIATNNIELEKSSTESFTKGTLAVMEDRIVETEVSSEGFTKTRRLREVDCMGLPSPPKRRRIESDNPIVNGEAISCLDGATTHVSVIADHTAESEEPGFLSMEPVISSTPVTEISEPILCSQMLRQMSRDSSRSLSETLTEEELNLALLGSQTDGISDTDSNKENIPPLTDTRADFDDTASCEDIALENSQHMGNADSTFNETLSNLGSQDQPLVLDGTETETGSDLETQQNDSKIQEQYSRILEDPILSTQELNVAGNENTQATAMQQAAGFKPEYIRTLSEKRFRDTAGEEPPEKKSRPSIDEPILSTQDLQTPMPERFDVESCSTESSIQIVGELGPSAASRRQPLFNSDVKVIEEDVFYAEEDEDKENRQPPDFMDMPIQTEESDSDDFTNASSDDARGSVKNTAQHHVISQTETSFESVKSDTDDDIEEILQDTSVQDWSKNQETQQLKLNVESDIDAGKSETDSDIEEIDEEHVMNVANSEKSDTDDEIREMGPTVEFNEARKVKPVENIVDEKSSTDDDIQEIDQDDVSENTEIDKPKGQEVYSESYREENYSNVVVERGNPLDIVKITSNAASNVQVSGRNTDNLTQKLFSDDDDGEIVEIGLRPEVSYESDVDITTCETQKIPADEDADVVLEVEPNEQLIEGNSITSQTCETQKIPVDEEDDVVLEVEFDEELIENNSITSQTCETQKIPTDEEDDVLEVEPNEHFIKGSKSFTSETCENLEIISDDIRTSTIPELSVQTAQFVENTIRRAREKLKKDTYSEREEHSVNEIIDAEVVAQEVEVMMLDDRQDATSTVSENTLYNGDQQVSSQNILLQNETSGCQPTSVISIDGIVDEVKGQDDFPVISDIKSLVEQPAAAVRGLVETNDNTKLVPIRNVKEKIIQSKSNEVTAKTRENPSDIASEVESSVDADDEISVINVEGGQFDDADSDDSIPHCTPRTSLQRKSPKPKAYRTRSCRSMPYEKPNRLGTTPMPVGARRQTVATGRNIIKQSVDEVLAMTGECPSPRMPSSLSARKQTKPLFRIEQVKAESPQSLSLPAWNVTIDDETAGSRSPELGGRILTSTANLPVTVTPLGKFLLTSFVLL